jgi:hypothetical protein
VKAWRAAALALLAALSVPAPARAADELNGFSLEKLTVPRSLLVAGGPGRDDIPSVDAPRFVPAKEAVWSPPDATLIGVALGGEARGYPTHLVERHVVVNDVFGKAPVAVVYDPLAGAPVAFSRKLGGRTLSFGVSGLVQNGAIVLYDRETQSLWSPLLGQAIAGKLAGERVERMRVRQETTAQWLARTPGSVLLAPPEPEKIDYRYSPYSTYWVQETIPFPVAAKDDRYHPKELVLGVVVKGRVRAYLGSQLTAAGGVVTDELVGVPVKIAYSTDEGVVQWDVPAGAELQEAYWFAWKALHPDTEVWEPKATDRAAPPPAGAPAPSPR